MQDQQVVVEVLPASPPATLPVAVQPLLKGETPPCPRCALTPEQRAKNKHTAHAKDCPKSWATKPKKKSQAVVKRGDVANPLTQLMRGAFLEAYAELGGHGGFITWAKKNRTAFYRAMIRAMPKEQREALGSGVNVIVQGTASFSPKPVELDDHL